MRKKIIRTSMAWILVAAMVSGIVLSWIPAGGAMMARAEQRNVTKESESSYVITVKDESVLDNVCEKYDDILDFCPEENPDTLTEEGILVSDMTAAEAAKLENDSRVLSVEENFALDGSRKKRGKHTEKTEDNSHVEYQDAGQDDNWNLEIIHAANADDVSQKNKVKVAILDSGVDILENIEVKERVNLIPGQEDFTVMFEDEAGHGTAVAGIIAGETMSGETADGINKNVELYSAKVLDEKNQAPLSRIIEGIYWAIEQDVHIINMSFGTDRYSQALEDAVKAASDKGILIVAAAGNQGESGMDTVEYPAAFPEVVAVGSMDAQGEVSEFSAKGEEIELVAPGEAVRVTGAFGADMVVSGTSMAAPHVTAVASLLWGKDLSKSAEFIRTLLDESARDLGSETEAGYGLIDYEYAQKVYDRVESQMENGKEVNVPENNAKVQVFDNSGDVKRLEECEKGIEDGEVKGSWQWEVHQEYLNSNNVNLPAMKAGSIYPDKGESGAHGMKDNPEFHGYYQTTSSQNVNYVASYHFMIKIAEAYGKGKDYTTATKVKGLSDASYNIIRQRFKGMNKKIKSYSSNKDRKAFVYGIAMHTATDAFSHSTLLKQDGAWYRIQHKAHKNNPVIGADNTKVKPRRHKMALRVERNVVWRYQGKRSDVSILHDFHAAGDEDGEYYAEDKGGNRYRSIRLGMYAKEAGVTNATVQKHFDLISKDYSE